MSDETRTLIREQWDRCVKLHKRCVELSNWLPDHQNDPEWSELCIKAMRVAAKRNDALDAVYEALGHTNVTGLWARLEACGEVKCNA